MRYPVQRASVSSAADLTIHRTRPRSRMVGRNGDERVQTRIERPRTGEERLDNIRRRNLTGSNELAELTHRLKTSSSAIYRDRGRKISIGWIASLISRSRTG